MLRLHFLRFKLTCSAIFGAKIGDRNLAETTKNTGLQQFCQLDK